MLLNDEYYMNEALKEAHKALNQDEVPVGAIVVCQGTIIARAHNQTETLKDATAHAEMIALTSAQSYLGSKYLNDCTIYITLEPCVMCAGALHWTKIGRICFGADDPKFGSSLVGKRLYHPKTEVTTGVLDVECGKVLTDFFKKKRSVPKQ
ncbi:MAG: tRNA-specific adenosine deaminase [Bacteroidetes bacterium HGW-Bacteroidetes-21]|nr:MAG: tRNA-specific adenosine deaminase [Bacteroidetes bacterium HGW-Bacteroidetes-21]